MAVGSYSDYGSGISVFETLPLRPPAERKSLKWDGAPCPNLGMGTVTLDALHCVQGDMKRGQVPNHPILLLQ